MTCFPLNNTLYEAKDMGAYLATRTRGVYSADRNLAVAPGDSGLAVLVSPGLAWLRWSEFWGVCALQEQELLLSLDKADGVLQRIDAIVCRLDKVNNRAEIVAKKGAFSSAPVVEPPVRNANYDEIYLATVLIRAGAIGISAADITDQRLNEAYCGLMRDGVTGIPTTQLYAQWAAFFAQTQQDTADRQQQADAAFAAWFNRIKDLFAEDPAGSLQTQIDALEKSKADALHTHTKEEVGLGNVDNTADSEKSVHYAETAGSAVDQTARNTANNAMPKTGGTFTGNVVAYGTNRTSSCLRNIYVNGVSTNYILMVRK